MGGGCYGDITYDTPKMDSSNLNIFSEINSLGGNLSLFFTKSTNQNTLLLLLDYLLQLSKIVISVRLCFL